MSFVHPDGSPADASRALVDRKSARVAFYRAIDPDHRRRAAMLALQELAGWTVRDIGRAMRCSHQSVLRGLAAIRVALDETTAPALPDRSAARTSVETVQQARRASDRQCRDQAMLTLSVLAGWTVREISQEFGLHHANVVRAIARAESVLRLARPRATDGFQDPRRPDSGS